LWREAEIIVLDPSLAKMLLQEGWRLPPQIGVTCGPFFYRGRVWLGWNGVGLMTDRQTIRVARAEDAEAMAAIYAPVVVNTAISFELEPPSVEEMRQRIVSTLERLPWLVSLDNKGAVSGFAYASRHRERLAYQ